MADLRLFTRINAEESDIDSALQWLGFHQTMAIFLGVHYASGAGTTRK
jgi:hypothetical protein